MSRHTAGYRSAEAVLRTNQDHFSAFAIVRFRSRNPVTFVVAKMVHGQAHKRSPPSRHVVDACRTGFWDAEDEELAYAVGSSEDGALTAALVTIWKSGVCHWGRDSSGEVCCLTGDFLSISNTPKQSQPGIFKIPGWLL